MATFFRAICSSVHSCAAPRARRAGSTPRATNGQNHPGGSAPAPTCVARHWACAEVFADAPPRPAKTSANTRGRNREVGGSRKLTTR